MSYKCVLHRCLLLSLVVLLCNFGIWADSSTDPCNSAPSACTATCTSSPCQVQLTSSGGTVSLTYNGTDASILCAPDNATVKWATQTATPASMIGLFFNASHYPGSSNIVVGSSAIAASSTVTATSSSQACYVYSIAVCGATGSCSTKDPRVVVTGVNVQGKHAKKRHQPKP